MNEVCEIMTVTWAIWFCCNKFVYENENVNAQAMAMNFLRMIEEYKKYSRNVFPSVSSGADLNPSAMCWKCPQDGVTKFNLDVHIVKGRYVSLGVVLRDACGSLLMATKRLEEIQDSTMAEAEVV